MGKLHRMLRGQLSRWGQGKGQTIFLLSRTLRSQILNIRLMLGINSHSSQSGWQPEETGQKFRWSAAGISSLIPASLSVARISLRTTRWWLARGRLCFSRNDSRQTKTLEQMMWNFIVKVTQQQLKNHLNTLYNVTANYITMCKFRFSQAPHKEQTGSQGSIQGNQLL